MGIESGNSRGSLEKWKAPSSDEILHAGAGGAYVDSGLDSHSSSQEIKNFKKRIQEEHLGSEIEYDSGEAGRVYWRVKKYNPNTKNKAA